MHCFSGGRQLAEEMIDLGFFISIPGVATFTNAHTLHEVIRATDLRHLLLETDGPYLAPVPFRGKRNEPKLMLYTAQKVAELKQVPLDEVAQMTALFKKADEACKEVPKRPEYVINDDEIILPPKIPR